MSSSGLFGDSGIAVRGASQIQCPVDDRPDDLVTNGDRWIVAALVDTGVRPLREPQDAEPCGGHADNVGAGEAAVREASLGCPVRDLPAERVAESVAAGELVDDLARNVARSVVLATLQHQLEQHGEV